MCNVSLKTYVVEMIQVIATIVKQLGDKKIYPIALRIRLADYFTNLKLGFRHTLYLLSISVKIICSKHYRRSCLQHIDSVPHFIFVVNNIFYQVVLRQTPDDMADLILGSKLCHRYSSAKMQ